MATRVLTRVWDDGAYAAPTLDAELRRHPGLDPRDIALATELVYGVLRTGPVLEQWLDAYAKRGKSYKRRAALRAPLLMGAYTLAFLDRVPAFAAISQAVEAVKATGGPRVGGFANAILRKLARRFEKEGRPALEPSVAAAVPSWLRGAITSSVGETGLTGLLGTGGPPPTGVCLIGDQDRGEWLTKLRAAAPEADIQEAEVSPRGVLVRSAGDVRQLPGADEHWVIQEEGAQVVALVAGGQTNETLLDACAGRGGKTFMLAEAVGRGGAVDAADRQPSQLARLQAAARSKLVRNAYAVDWTRGTGDVPLSAYDRVLVDAPCSGTGTLRRRPEIATRLGKADLARLGALQTEIAQRAARTVRTGGRLIYAVCSVLQQEAGLVATRLAEPTTDQAERLRPCPFDSELGARLAAGGPTIELLPHVHGTDGYFIASFVVER